MVAIAIAAQVIPKLQILLQKSVSQSRPIRQRTVTATLSRWLHMVLGMGYDYHITRADDWADNADACITPDEWLTAVKDDPELSLACVNGPYFAEWRDSWFDLVDGNITTKNPDTPTLDKKLSIAAGFGARVQGDDGDIYDGTESLDAPTSPNLIIAWLRFLGIYFLGVLGLILLSIFICYLFGMYDV